MIQRVVLMRPDLAEESELEEAAKHLRVYTNRASVPSGSEVVGRYSVLPYYKELETDLAVTGSKLINTYRQHCYVADIRNWYEDLKDVTPETFFSLEEFNRLSTSEKKGSFVLKGATNSKKQQWNTHMFASTSDEVCQVYRRLSDDSFVGNQDIYIRRYVPLTSFGFGIRGIPMTEEYRFFVLDGKVVGSGYYWSQYPEIQEENGLHPRNVPESFLSLVISVVSQNIRFFVVDVARKADGGWIVVELNDGCMSGLSDVPASMLYSSIAG